MGGKASESSPAVAQKLWFKYILSCCSATCAELGEATEVDTSSIGCPRIIRTYDFTRISSLWCNRRSSSFQTFLKYTSRVIDECCIVPRSGRGLVPPPVRLALGYQLFMFCSNVIRTTIDKKHSLAFHSMAADMTFAGHPLNRVWKPLNISGTQIFHPLRWKKKENDLIGSPRLDRKPRPDTLTRSTW